MPNYSVDNITYYKAYYYAEYHDSVQKVIINGYKPNSLVEYSDQYFIDVANINTIEIGTGISKINKNSFKISPSVSFIFNYNIHTFIQQKCFSFSFINYAFFIFMLLS